jgi:ribosomal protein L37E
MDEEINTNEEIDRKEPVCPRCGLRSYDETCQACGTPIVDNKDDEDEDYNWREKYR